MVALGRRPSDSVRSPLSPSDCWLLLVCTSPSARRADARTRRASGWRCRSWAWTSTTSHRHRCSHTVRCSSMVATRTGRSWSRCTAATRGRTVALHRVAARVVSRHRTPRSALSLRAGRARGFRDGARRAGGCPRPAPRDSGQRRARRCARRRPPCRRTARRHDSGLAPVDESGLAALWSQLALLHDAGITHRQVDLDRIVRHADGTLGFGDLSSASVTTSPARQLQDQAQMLALSIAALGEERALAVARTAVGAESLPQVLPYLQDAAVPPAFALSSSTMTSTSTRCACGSPRTSAPPTSRSSACAA